MGGETDTDQSLSRHQMELIDRSLTGLNPRSSASFPTNGATKSEPIYNSALSFHSRFVKFYDDNKVLGMASLSGRPSPGVPKSGRKRAWVGEPAQLSGSMILVSMNSDKTTLSGF